METQCVIFILVIFTESSEKGYFIQLHWREREGLRKFVSIPSSG